MTESRPFSETPKYIPFDSPDGVVVPLRNYFLTDRDLGEISIVSDSAPLDPTIASVGSSGSSTSISEGSGPDNSNVFIGVGFVSPNQLISENQSSSISINATLVNGNPDDLFYQWQKKDNGTDIWYDITGATTDQLQIGPTVFANDHEDRYRCVLTAELAVNSPLISREILVEVRRVITITQQAQSDKTSYVIGDTATLTVVATITSDVISYQWQERLYADTAFVNVTDGSGGDTSNYITPPLTANDQAKEYLCILTNAEANTVISQTTAINVFGADLSISPTVDGITFWSFAANGDLILDGGSSTEYDINILNEDKIFLMKMWGQGAPNCSDGYGGYSEALVPVEVNSSYVGVLNYGGGSSSTNPGGGLSGFFKGSTVSHSNSYVIAGGAGGNGSSTTNSCAYLGGEGGGTTGGNGSDVSSSLQGGDGGTQTGGGAGGTTNLSVSFSKTYTSGSTVSIPNGVTNVNYTIHGGKGGKGGPANTRVTTSGAPGARGQKITGSLTNVAGQTLTLTMGGAGGDGGGVVGGNGGTGYVSGGKGGNDGSDTDGYDAGAGGGGGGATAITAESTLLALAGGGGGGACICFSSVGPTSGYTSTSITNSGTASNGGTGTTSGASFNGGGGGGGGGVPGGNGGYAAISGNDTSGTGGYGGGGYYNSNNHSTIPTVVTSDSDTSYITISYQIVASNGSDGSALQGGAGGGGVGPGGGGGYYGGGGGGRNTSPNESGGGGGGSGFIDAAVESGTTQAFANSSDPVRGNAGEPGEDSRIVISMDIITINQEPSFDQSAYSTGQTATVSINASITGGKTITYQWQLRLPGDTVWNDISSSNSSSYSFVVNSATDAGKNFRCVLQSSYAPTIISNSVVLYTLDKDIQIFDGTNTTLWSLSTDGPFSIESGTAKEYTITIINDIIDFEAKLWGQGGETCSNSGKGGYTYGVLPAPTGNVFKFVLSTGGGSANGYYGGGGYAGIFANTVAHSNSRLIAGGGGGAGYAGGCGPAGGNAGGTSGSSGSNGEFAFAGGGGGGTQSSGGSGGTATTGNLSSGGRAGSGSALKGGNGGAPSSNYQNDFSGGFWYYYGTYYGGGGGAGYYGGGGGGGGAGFTCDGGQAVCQWSSSGGGGGSSYIHSSVVSGVTSELTGTALLNDPDRNNAGNPGSGRKSRIVIKERQVLYSDSAGRLLILSCATSLRNPSTLVKTNGRVLPNTNKVIDNTRWQALRSASGDYRLVPTLAGSKKPLITPISSNISKMVNSNVISLSTDLLSWQQLGSNPFDVLAWDEDSGSDGTGLDYSGLLWDYNSGFGYYSQSSNNPFSENFAYGFKTANWWILPDGVSNFTKSSTQSASSVTQKPSCTSAQYGIYTRSGSSQSSFPHTDTKQIVILWAGSVIYDGDATVVQQDGGITVGDYTYVVEGHVASNYGWNSDGVSCGTASSPAGDYVNCFNVARWG